jgi:CAAX protease family protein
MTMITTTYPIPDIEAQHPATTTAGRRAWGFWATLGWFGAAVATHFAVAILFSLGFAIWWIVSQRNLEVGIEPPTFQYFTVLFATLVPALVLTLAARRAGPSAQGYLGLTMPAKRHILIGLGLTAVFWCMSETFFHLFPAFDQTPELIREYRGLIGNPSALTMYWLTTVVTAPLFEEIIFRGFLMRGWSESRIGAMGAVMLSSLVFAAIHVQYNLVNMAVVLGLGLLLGVMRWRSGSTMLTMVLHAAWNLACVVTFALQA